MSADERIHLTLAARPENVAVVRHVLGAFHELRPFRTERADEITLAVTEAASNVVVHAYGQDDGPLLVSAGVAGTHLTVRIGDHGRGMTSPSLRPGLGVGLPLIRSLSERLEISECEGGGTVLDMEFDLDAEPRTAPVVELS